jgi:UDP-glucose 4-epimerase
MGTLNLMRAVELKKAKQFIFSSTEWVYDSFTEGEIKDEQALINISRHNSEYALSKLVSEANLRQKYRHGFCPVTILRFGIIYGPRTANWSAVEALLHSVATSDSVTVGSLKTGRHFIHVDDIITGIIKALGLSGFEIINLQGDRLVTLGEIIEASKKLVGKNPQVVQKDPGNISIRPVSNVKARRLLDWQPYYDIEAGLQSIRGIVLSV